MRRLLANKKRLILAGASFVFLAAAGIGVNIFMGGEKTPPPPPPGEAPRPEQLPAGPPPLSAAALPKYTLSFEPFWVEQKDAEGAIRFLSLAFAVPTDNDMLFAELNGKRIVLRDALFYYLSRRPLVTLQDEATMESLKSDLATVINEHVANGKINDIFIENYLVK
jgi:flagellar FliL protein